MVFNLQIKGNSILVIGLFVNALSTVLKLGLFILKFTCVILFVSNANLSINSNL